MCSKKHIRCYLCGRPLAEPTSVDHVPPLLFFPKELRRAHNLDKLLTVPVHAACNLSYQLDEEYFVHTLLPMTGGSEAGNAHHIRVRQKMQAGKNVALVNKVMDEFKHVVKGVHLPANRVAKLIDHNRFFRVLWKVIRGLHYHHSGEILPEEWGMRYWITPPYEPPEELFKLYAESGQAATPRGDYPKVFSYFFDRFKPDGWNFQYWGFHLWDSIVVTAMFHDPACGCDDCQFIGPRFPVSMIGTIKA